MKRKMVLTGTYILFVMGLAGQPPNNAIFHGGTGDGCNSYNFSGAANSIFLGANGAGWNNHSNNVLANSIFLGGVGDGWHNSVFYPAPNSIFLGGEGDGWSFSNFNIAANSIFIGGVGDGWSQVTYPLGALPLTLLSFTGQQQGKTNLLNWATSQEVNTSHFELERSANPNGFSVINKILAAGNSNKTKKYSSVDELPLAGNNFYRLKMVDADGKFKYSNVILLRALDNNVLLSVFPNPVADKLNIAISNNAIISKLQLQVFDVGGKLMGQQSAANSNTISIDVGRYAAGVYLLKIIYNGKEETIRFVKAK